MTVKAKVATLRALFNEELNRDGLFIEGYKNSHGEDAVICLNTKAEYTELVKASLQALDIYTAGSVSDSTGVPVEICQTALDELRDSFSETLTEGPGNNSRYTHSADRKLNGEATYEQLAHGVKVHTETGAVMVSGIEINKTVRTAGVYKTVNKQPKTLAKDYVRNQLPLAKWRTFKLDGDGGNFVSLRNGQKVFRPADFT
jgi:hypothetical protein